MHRAAGFAVILIRTSAAERLGTLSRRAGGVRAVVINGVGRIVCAVTALRCTKRGIKTKRINGKSMEYGWYDFIGSIGVGMIILTYVGLQTGKIKSEALIYSILNALGATLIIISLVYSFNLSAFIVEFFWVLISIYGIIKYFLKKAEV